MGGGEQEMLPYGQRYFAVINDINAEIG